MRPPQKVLPNVIGDIEARVVQGLTATDTVIATGGSVVYRPATMAHLRAHGTTVYLAVSCATLEARVRNIATRGIAKRGSGPAVKQRHGQNGKGALGGSGEILAYARIILVLESGHRQRQARGYLGWLNSSIEN